MYILISEYKWKHAVVRRILKYQATEANPLESFNEHTIGDLVPYHRPTMPIKNTMEIRSASPHPRQSPVDIALVRTIKLVQRCDYLNYRKRSTVLHSAQAVT